MSTISSLHSPFTTAPFSPPSTSTSTPTSATIATKLSPRALLDFSILLQTYLPPSLADSWDPNLPLGINISSLLNQEKQLGLQGLCVCGCVCRRKGVGPEKVREQEITRVVAEKFSTLLAATQAKMPEFGKGYEVQEEDAVLRKDDPGKSLTCWYRAKTGHKCNFTTIECRDLHAFVPVSWSGDKGLEKGEVEELARRLGLMVGREGDADMELDVNKEEVLGNEMIEGWKVVIE